MRWRAKQGDCGEVTAGAEVTGGGGQHRGHAGAVETGWILAGEVGMLSKGEGAKEGLRFTERRGLRY